MSPQAHRIVFQGIVNVTAQVLNVFGYGFCGAVGERTNVIKLEVQFEDSQYDYLECPNLIKNGDFEVHACDSAT
jgi:hypothetical protein